MTDLAMLPASHVLRTAVVALLLAATVAAQPAPVYTVERGDTLFKIAQAHGLTVDQLKAYNGLSSNILSIGQQLYVTPDPDGGRAGWTEEGPLPDAPLDPPLDDGEPEEDERLGEGQAVGLDPASGREGVLIAPEPIPAGPPPPAPPPAAMARVRIGAGTRGEVIAAPPVSSGEAAVHVVQPGETLFTISRRYGMTVDALRSRNGLTGDLLSVGQELVVSGEAAPAAPPLPAAVPRAPYDLTESTVPGDQVHVTRKGETLYTVAARYGMEVGALLALNTLTTAPIPAGTVLVLPDSAARYYRAPAPLPPPDETGLALVYPDSYRGRDTISGDPYDPAALTASHRTLPFGTVLRVTLPARGRSVLVRVNDRGPVSEGFLIELSEAAAEALGQDRGAAERVEVRVVP